MTQAPMSTPPSGGALRPHRGVMILVFGILGFVLCLIFGIVAWVMGNSDLKEMDAGRMDPEGRGLTQAGKIIGMIAVIIQAAVIALYVIIAIVAIGGAAAAGAAGGP